MKQSILNISISVLITFVILVGVFYFVPIGMFENPLNINQPLGTTITTISGTDTISGSRTTINNNFSALNSGKIESSTTTLPLITTLSNLTTIGTIISGGWTGTAIGVGYGGTGTTSPSLNLVMLGNTTSGFKVVNGFGTTGQFLTSNGVNSAPTWQTSSVDQGIAYTWTGLHTFNTTGAIFNASTTFNATTTILANSVTNGALNLNGINYRFPPTQTASSTVLMTNGSGNLIWHYPFSKNEIYTAGSSTVAAALTEETNSVGTYTKYKEIAVAGSGTIRITFLLHAQVGDAANAFGRIYVNGVAVGTERSNSSDTFIMYQEDIAVNSQDLVQIYCKNDGSNQAVLDNFIIYANRYEYTTVTND